MSYSGAIEVGVICIGMAKSVTGTGVTSRVGTGDITCASSVVDLAEETKAGPDTSKLSGSCYWGANTTVRLLRVW